MSSADSNRLAPRGDTPEQDAEAATLKLGLIGDNIAQSKAPLLHRLAGEIAGLAVTYDRLVPRELGVDFDETFDICTAGSYRGVNITYPYKERAAARTGRRRPPVRADGAGDAVGTGAERGASTPTIRVSSPPTAVLAAPRRPVASASSAPGVSARPSPSPL